MKQTDFEIAQEYAKLLYPNANPNLASYFTDGDKYDLSSESYLAGLQKGREQSDEKAMRFAEWTNMKGWTYNYMVKKWYNTILPKTALTEELYNSEGFAEYLKQFEK